MMPITRCTQLPQSLISGGAGKVLNSDVECGEETEWGWPAQDLIHQTTVQFHNIFTWNYFN